LCQGGTGDAWNLWPACRSCNRRKCGRTPCQWLADMRAADQHERDAYPWPDPPRLSDTEPLTGEWARYVSRLRSQPLPPVGYLAAEFAASAAATSTAPAAFPAARTVQRVPSTAPTRRSTRRRGRQLGVRIPEELYARLVACSEGTGISQGRLLQRAIEVELQRH
jgi:hypothetical protein